jgi:hypothetical protein
MMDFFIQDVFIDVLNTIAMVPAAKWVQVILAAGLFEFAGCKRQWTDNNPIPGNYLRIRSSWRKVDETPRSSQNSE